MLAIRRAASNKLLLQVTGVLEAATGLALLVAPSMVLELLFRTALIEAAGLTVGRVAGVALLTLGIVCWLARKQAAGGGGKDAVTAMLIYNVGVVAVLVFAWSDLTPVGIAFWPVVLAHIGLAALLFSAWRELSQLPSNLKSG